MTKLQKTVFLWFFWNFLHSAKNFTRTAFTAFMTNVRYANNEVKYHITPCSFFFSFIKVCLIFPVSMSLSVHMASEKQSKQGSFLFRPTSGQPSDLHQEVGVSFISPSLIRLFRDFSKMFNVRLLTQHLKNPPFFLQSSAKLDCSWKIH